MKDYRPQDYRLSTHLISRLENLESSSPIPAGKGKVPEEVKKSLIGATNDAFPFKDGDKLYTFDTFKKLMEEFYSTFGCTVEFTDESHHKDIRVFRRGEEWREFPSGMGTISLYPGRIFVDVISYSSSPEINRV